MMYMLRINKNYMLYTMSIKIGYMIYIQRKVLYK